jgi:membrane dipeptidase
MVDISHVSDKTFFDVLEITRAPVLASHSSLRAISNHPRNMTDDMLRALATNGGVVMINYNRRSSARSIASLWKALSGGRR